MTQNHNNKRQAPFSLRLSFKERAQLEKNAGNMPMSAYIKSLIFAEDAPTYRARRRAAPADEKKLAEVLACLGASCISNNLNQLAKAANHGALHVDEETKAKLDGACDDVRIMRRMLMQALGMQVEDAKPKESTSQTFTRAAAKRPDAYVRTQTLRPS